MSRFCAWGPRWAGLVLGYTETNLALRSTGIILNPGVTGAGLAFESAVFTGRPGSWGHRGQTGAGDHWGGPGI